MPILDDREYEEMMSFERKKEEKLKNPFNDEADYTDTEKYAHIEMTAYISRDDLYSAGEEADLEGNALHYFSHAEEVHVELTVERESGAVVKVVTV